MDFLASFFTLLLYSCRVRQEGEYKLWWDPSHKRMFDVGSFYRVLACKDRFPFPSMSIWLTSKVPLRGFCFVLFFHLVGNPRKDSYHGYLRKWHVIVVDKRSMCKRNGESVDHLLFHCEVAYALWNDFFSCFWLSWVMPNLVDLFACWWTGGRSQSVVVWKIGASCLLWCPWRERND